jgi:hypothetical protein
MLAANISLNWERSTAIVCALLVVALAGCDTRVDLGPVPNAAAASDIRKSFGVTEAAEGAGDQAAAATGTGWATIRGRFVYDGDPPKMGQYAVNKDMATCAPGGHIPELQTLLVDSGNHGIKNVAVILRDASRVNDSAQPKGGDELFDQKQCVFLTHVAGVEVGESLDIKNSDDVGHNTNISGKNSFNQTIPTGQTITLKIQKEEALPVPVNCSIHPWMSAYLLPRKNGYYAITAADGSFEIKNVPAGEKLEFQVWHESAAGSGKALVVNTPDAKKLNWNNKGRFTVTLEPDEDRKIEIKVPPSAFSG